MSSVTIRPYKPFHALLLNGEVIEVGKGNVTYTPSVHEVLFFDSIQEREGHELVSAFLNSRSEKVHRATEVESTKSTDAYTAMRQDAMDWLRAVKAGTAEWDADLYPALAITVEECNKTPTEAAEAIRDAVEVNVLAAERKRTQARERLNSLQN